MKVLLAVDGSDASMSAVAAAHRLATPARSSIEVVSVIPDSFATDGSPWPNVVRVDPPSDRDRVRDDVATRLEEIASRFRPDRMSVEAKVLEGRPATEIVAEATRSGADLIVIGARGQSAVRRLLLGSVSSEVVDHAPCPVLVARHAGIDRVMLATDGSPGALDAAGFIADTGLFGSARIRVVSIVDPGMPWWAGIAPVDGAASVEAYRDAVEVSEQHAREAAEKAAARLRGLQVEAEALTGGDVVAAILDEATAWRPDVIVLGARDIGTVRRWLLGSVSRSILHHAEASVLIVRSGAAAAPAQEATLATSA